MRLYKLLSLAILVVALSFKAQSDDVVYHTSTGTGPDKWVSVWYLENQVLHPGAVKVLPKEEIGSVPLDKQIDEQGAKFQRTGSSTTFSAILDYYPPANSTSLALGKIVHEIEIDAWSGDVSFEARVVEQDFRNMQLRYGRDVVSKDCYLIFFDNVAEHLQQNTLAKMDSPDDLIPNKSCLNSETIAQAPVKLNSKVPTLPLEEVLKLSSSKNKPLFLDTRETWEFNEGHIPGAINMKLREINEQSASTLLSEHTVVAYCVKDFRGYEAAKKLRKLGVNAVIMTPHGMRGWIAADLPVAGSRGTAEDLAMSELERIAKESSRVVVQ